jgi:hypothetical protein
MSRARQPGKVPGAPAPPGRCRADVAGDPLVRALAVCIRQAHVRRVGRGRVD